MDADPPDELLLNTIATINNLSYYMVDDDDDRGLIKTDGAMILNLACGLRSLAYR